MSTQPLLIAGEAIADASVDALLTTAHALVREAVDKARGGTSGTSREALIEQVVACQQLQNSTWAAQSVRLAQVAAIEEVAEPGEAPREVRHAIGSYADAWLPQELGARLGWSDRQTTHRLTEAVDAIRTVPRLFERTVDGSLDPRKLNIVAESLCGVRPKVARKVEGRLLAAIDDAQASNGEDDQPISMTSTKLVRRTRRLLADLAPADAERAAKRSRANAKSVRAYPHHEPGVSAFHAVLPTEGAMRIMAGINELARQLHKDTTTGKSLDECRVDAFIDLVLGKVSVNTTCVVHLPLFPVPAGAGDAAGSGDDEAFAGVVHFPGRRQHGGFGEQPDWPVSSFVEPKLEDLLRRAAEEGIDILTRLDAPSANVVVRTPCDADALIAARPGAVYAQRVEINWAPRDSECSQRWDPVADPPPGGPDRSKRRRSDGPSGASASSPPDGFRVGDAVVEGLGVIPASALVAMCRTLGVKLTRALVDVKTGATVETSDTTYRPGARLRRFVVTRDQHCRFPGCTRPARLDDVDHVIRWPDGPTAAWNLQCLCRHHHRAKHEGGWQVSMTPDGVCTWTSPSGRRYSTRPAD